MSSLNTLKRRWKVAAVLAAVLLLHGLANGYWISRDRTLRGNDMGPHIQGVAMAKSWITQEGLAGGVARVARGKSPIYWPSAGYLIWGAPALLLGHGIDAQRNYNLFFLGLMAVSLLLMGRKLHSWRAGLLAAALIPLYPGVFGEGRQVGVDFPGAAMVTACMALLLSSRFFAVTWRSVALGACVGLATLVRPLSDFFLAAPVLLAFVLGLRRPHGVSRKRVLLNGLLSLLALLLVTSVWWYGNLEEIVREFGRHKQGYGFARQGSPFVFYTRAIVLGASPFLLGVFGVAVAAIGVSWWRGRKAASASASTPASEPPASDLRPPASGLLLVLAWMVGGLGIHSLIQVHMLRYLLPLLPALALVTAVGLMSMRQGMLRRVAVGGVLFGAGVGWLFGTLDIVGFPLPQVRPLTTQKIDKAEPYVPAGPPLNNPYMLTLERVVRMLRARHGTGKGVLLRLVMDHKDVDELIVRWASAPIFGVGLPDLRITEQRFPEYILNHRPDGTRDELINFSSIPYPDRSGPIKHCYTLRMFTSSTAAPDGDTSCKKVLDLSGALSPLEDPRPIRLTVYHYPHCPLNVCAAEGREPREP